MTSLTWGELDVMQAYTGLSRVGLGEPRGQHLRHRTPDPAGTAGHRQRHPDGADCPTSDHRCGGLCLDYVRPCARGHRLGRRGIVYKRGLRAQTRVTRCADPAIVPDNRCSGARGLRRRPDERHGGSRCPDRGLSRRGGNALCLDDTARRRRTGLRRTGAARATEGAAAS